MELENLSEIDVQKINYQRLSTKKAGLEDAINGVFKVASESFDAYMAYDDADFDEDDQYDSGWEHGFSVGNRNSYRNCVELLTKLQNKSNEISDLMDEIACNIDALQNKTKLQSVD